MRPAILFLFQLPRPGIHAAGRRTKPNMPATRAAGSCMFQRGDRPDAAVPPKPSPTPGSSRKGLLPGHDISRRSACRISQGHFSERVEISRPGSTEGETQVPSEFIKMLLDFPNPAPPINGAHLQTWRQKQTPRSSSSIAMARYSSNVTRSRPSKSISICCPSQTCLAVVLNNWRIGRIFPGPTLLIYSYAATSTDASPANARR